MVSVIFLEVESVVFLDGKSVVLLYGGSVVFSHCKTIVFLDGNVTGNENQIEIPAERGQDFVWRVEQRNKKTYLKFDVGENVE